MLNKIIKNQLKREYKNLDIRRTKAVENMVANGGKNKMRAMIAAGYKKGYAENPQKFLSCKKTQSLLNWIDYELTQIAERMDKTRNQAKYKELSDSFVNLKKLKLLTGGNPTEILKISEEEKKAVDDAFNLNS